MSEVKYKACLNKACKNFEKGRDNTNCILLMNPELTQCPNYTVDIIMDQKGWNRVELFQPEILERVFIYTEDHCYCIGYWDGCDWFGSYDNELITGVDYWMFLPEIPKEVSNE